MTLRAKPITPMPTPAKIAPIPSLYDLRRYQTPRGSYISDGKWLAFESHFAPHGQTVPLGLFACATQIGRWEDLARRLHIAGGEWAWQSAHRYVGTMIENFPSAAYRTAVWCPPGTTAHGIVIQERFAPLLVGLHVHGVMLSDVLPALLGTDDTGNLVAVVVSLGSHHIDRIERA